MLCVTKKDILLRAVQIAEKIVGKKESLPALSCILVTSGKALTLSATNLESGVTITVPADCKNQGVVAVPAGIFSQTLRSMGDGQITCTQTEQNLLVEARGSKTLIKTVSSDDFPKLETEKKSEGYSITISRSKLLSGIESVIYAASRSMIRPELGSVYIQVSDGSITFVATDSFRLAEKNNKDNSLKNSVDILIPLKHALELQFILEHSDVDDVTLEHDESSVVVIAGPVRFISRVVDATFPNYKEIIPKTFTTEVTVLKSDFAEALRKARVFAGGDQHVGFHVYPSKKTFTITAQSGAIGEMSDTPEAATSGEDIDSNFHIEYVSDCLQSIPGDSIHLGFAGIGRPLVVRGTMDQSMTYLVMPLNR